MDEAADRRRPAHPRGDVAALFTTHDRVRASSALVRRNGSRCSAIAAHRVREFERRAVVVDVSNHPVEHHGAGATVTIVKIGVRGEPTLRVSFHVDPVPVECVSHQGGARRRSRVEEAARDVVIAVEIAADKVSIARVLCFVRSGVSARSGDRVVQVHAVLEHADRAHRHTARARGLDRLSGEREVHGLLDDGVGAGIALPCGVRDGDREGARDRLGREVGGRNGSPIARDGLLVERLRPRVRALNRRLGRRIRVPFASSIQGPLWVAP